MFLFQLLQQLQKRMVLLSHQNSFIRGIDFVHSDTGNLFTTAKGTERVSSFYKETWSRTLKYHNQPTEINQLYSENKNRN